MSPVTSRPAVRRAAPALVLALLVALGALGPAATAAVRVAADRDRVAMRLGETFRFRATISNAGARPTPALVAHLNVVGLDRDVYVDPEDWSAERTQYVRPLGAGRSRTLEWSVKAVNAGDLAVYVVALEQRDDGTAAPAPVATGRPIAVSVTERRTIDSGGILPLALGIPGAVAAVALGTRAAARRRA